MPTPNAQVMGEVGADRQVMGEVGVDRHARAPAGMHQTRAEFYEREREFAAAAASAPQRDRHGHDGGGDGGGCGGAPESGGSVLEDFIARHDAGSMMLPPRVGGPVNREPVPSLPPLVLLLPTPRRASRSDRGPLRARYLDVPAPRGADGEQMLICKRRHARPCARMEGCIFRMRRAPHNRRA